MTTSVTAQAKKHTYIRAWISRSEVTSYSAITYMYLYMAVSSCVHIDDMRVQCRSSSEYPEKCPEIRILVLIFNFFQGPTTPPNNLWPPHFKSVSGAPDIYWSCPYTMHILKMTFMLTYVGSQDPSYSTVHWYYK